MSIEIKIAVICQQCHNGFSALRKSGKFCSNKCRQAAYRNRFEEKESCKIYTIGYEGRGLRLFVEILQANKIKQLIDIRDSTNGSFRADFNEDNIKYTLNREGIEYISKKEMGVPKFIRDSYKEEKMSILVFEDKYREMISTINMNELAKNIKESGKTALMCSEKFAIAKGKQKINCHRSILANILKETGAFDEIIHL